jgi:TPR repeat protein
VPTPEENPIVAAANALMRDESDYHVCLAYIDLHEHELGSHADYLRGLLYSDADKRLNGISRSPRKALACFVSAAAQGHLDASHEAGRMHCGGLGTPENIDLAVQFLSSAADRGHTLAAFDLANLLYENPQHSQADLALRWYETLADDPELAASALLKLGRIYSRGWAHVPSDPARGIAALIAAADRGSSNACMDLAYAYFRGRGVPCDLDRARAYAEQAGPDHLLYDEVMTLLNAPQA